MSKDWAYRPIIGYTSQLAHLGYYFYFRPTSININIVLSKAKLQGQVIVKCDYAEPYRRISEENLLLCSHVAYTLTQKHPCRLVFALLGL